MRPGAGQHRDVRRIFIGDIQGCRASLDLLLQRLDLRDDDRVCCVGDLVNRGPDSLGVLRRLREIDARSVLGNHDLALLKLAAAPRRGSTPRPLEDVLDAPDAADLITWLGRQPVVLVDGDIAVVHGGLHPDWPDPDAVAFEINGAVAAHLDGATDDRIVFATEVRYCDASGTRPPQDEPPPGPPFMAWDHWYAGRHTVVFGHWARRGLVASGRVRGVDTGCVYGGTLTAWIAEEDRFVQAPGLRP